MSNKNYQKYSTRFRYSIFNFDIRYLFILIYRKVKSCALQYNYFIKKIKNTYHKSLLKQGSVQFFYLCQRHYFDVVFVHVQAFYIVF